MHGYANVGFIQVLHNRRFRKLWLGQVVSAVGDYFYLLAVPILINQLTGSTWAIGLAQLFTVTLPGLLFSMPAGVLVDRWDRRRMMIATDLLRVVLVLGGLLVHNETTVWILWLSGFLASAASCFFFPAHLATIPLLVDESELAAANGLSQVTMTVAWTVGPAMAGFTIAWLGIGAAFIVDSVSFVVSALAVWSMGAVFSSQPQTQRKQTLTALWGEMTEGLRFVVNDPAVRKVILGMSTVQLGIGASNVLWIPLLARYYGAGSEALGVVDSVQGLGMALGGLTVGWMASHFPKAFICVVGFAVSGSMLGMIGIAPSYLIILIFSFILGAAYAPARAMTFTLLQQATPDSARGRVFGVLGLLTRSAGSLSTAGAAGAAELLGIRQVYLACGTLVATAGLIFIKVKEPKSTLPVRVETIDTLTISGE